MTKIKICGITSLKEIEIMNEIIPDYIGFVFANGRHKISIETARFLKKNINKDIKVVGVFFNEKIEKVKDIYQSGIIDFVQLHGTESNLYIDSLKKENVPIINRINDVINNINTEYYMLDSGSGSGITLNWDDLIIKNHNKLFIAGGIDTSNLLNVINKTNPYAVDISTGAELNGLKNKKIVSKLVNLAHYN
ncbi:phosphoribosylanthranilate isomerase [Lactobacillus sp. S2-2]|uniref:phosphoribosylanthranilate isomerase n=1 Tax=Lactobacillus sp. S2-2 TaxID=2692917 RepID=UPI001F3488F0|nr:phosphoribosylanthranilate isomerase [Lactobacillus sp. S2-2]MCF6515005.1 phosphoribosylanthranilate isomerase [Lactobacillus sp. S2-2]